jgi:hypothetical protein
VDVRDSVLGLTGRAGVGQEIPLRDGGATPDAQRSEVRQRHPGVADRDRDGEPVRGNLPCERDLAGHRCAHRSRIAEGDVDAAVLTRGVRVAADGKAAENGAVRRPRPRPRR